MDLALEMGMTTAGLSRAMTEREFRDWQAYAARRMLPMRRLELYLAQIALVVVKAAGGAKNATLSDFLFDPIAEEAEDDMGADDVAAYFGGTVVRKKTE
jgi:hypothetical protein